MTEVRLAATLREMNTALSPMWTLGDRIRKAREIHGWRQVDLAPKVHKARSTIASWESGAHQPSYAELTLVADVTKVNADWLLNGTTGDADMDAAIARYISRMAHPTAHVHQLVLDVAS